MRPVLHGDVVTAVRALAREPFLNDAGYCACMKLVFEALLARRRAVSRKRNRRIA